MHSLLDPNLAFIFFWLGLALIVLELIVPGHIFSGTIGTILLLLSFASFGLLPVRLLGILLLVASVVFFLLEIKVPGLGRVVDRRDRLARAPGAQSSSTGRGASTCLARDAAGAAAVATFSTCGGEAARDPEQAAPNSARAIHRHAGGDAHGLSPEGVVCVASEEMERYKVRPWDGPRERKVKVTRSTASGSRSSRRMTTSKLRRDRRKGGTRESLLSAWRSSSALVVLFPRTRSGSMPRYQRGRVRLGR